MNASTRMPLQQCPCCDHFSLDQRAEYDICRVCFWEDDGNDLDQLDAQSGPNRMSLREARAHFLAVGACDERMRKNVVSVAGRAAYKFRQRATPPRTDDADLAPTVEVTPGWTFAGLVTDGDSVWLGGLDPWSCTWHALEPAMAIQVAHPQHPHQGHTLQVYELRGEGRVIQFAAGIFSNGVWGFYVPRP